MSTLPLIRSDVARAVNGLVLFVVELDRHAVGRGAGEEAFLLRVDVDVVGRRLRQRLRGRAGRPGHRRDRRAELEAPAGQRVERRLVHEEEDGVGLRAAPICAPTLAPARFTNAGALQPVAVLRMKTPSPPVPPTMNAPLTRLPKTATPRALSATAAGMVLTEATRRSAAVACSNLFARVRRHRRRRLRVARRHRPSQPQGREAHDGHDHDGAERPSKAAAVPILCRRHRQIPSGSGPAPRPAGGIARWRPERLVQPASTERSRRRILWSPALCVHAESSCPVRSPHCRSRSRSPPPAATDRPCPAASRRSARRGTGGADARSGHRARLPGGPLAPHRRARQQRPVRRQARAPQGIALDAHRPEGPGRRLRRNHRRSRPRPRRSPRRAPQGQGRRQDDHLDRRERRAGQRPRRRAARSRRWSSSRSRRSASAARRTDAVDAASSDAPPAAKTDGIGGVHAEQLPRPIAAGRRPRRPLPPRPRPPAARTRRSSRPDTARPSP